MPGIVLAEMIATIRREDRLHQSRLASAAQRLCETLGIDARPWGDLRADQRGVYIASARGCCEDYLVYSPLAVRFDDPPIDDRLSAMGYVRPEQRERVEAAACGLIEAFTDGAYAWPDLPASHKVLLLMIIGEEACRIQPAAEPRCWLGRLMRGA